MSVLLWTPLPRTWTPLPRTWTPMPRTWTQMPRTDITPSRHRIRTNDIQIESSRHDLPPRTTHNSATCLLAEPPLCAFKCGNPLVNFFTPWTHAQPPRPDSPLKMRRGASFGAQIRAREGCFSASRVRPTVKFKSPGGQVQIQISRHLAPPRGPLHLRSEPSHTHVRYIKRKPKQMCIPWYELPPTLRNSSAGIQYQLHLLSRCSKLLRVCTTHKPRLISTCACACDTYNCMAEGDAGRKLP